jgi:hypothetical protein
MEDMNIGMSSWRIVGKYIIDIQPGEMSTENCFG